MKFKHMVTAVIVSAALLCPLAFTSSHHLVKADDNPTVSVNNSDVANSTDNSNHYLVTNNLSDSRDYGYIESFLQNHHIDPKQWLANHTYKAQAKVHYVKYLYRFSYHKWRPAFVDDESPRIGVTKNYRAVKKAVKHFQHYKAQVVIKPWQAFKAKYIGHFQDEHIYLIKFRGGYYYYGEDSDKWGSEINPVSAVYEDGRFSAGIKPWWQKNIYLNYHHKLHRDAKWEYRMDTLNVNDYLLHGHKWHETLDSADLTGLADTTVYSSQS